MRSDTSFAISAVGEDSERVYDGSFSVKSTVTRRETFEIDRLRRQIIGPSPDGTPPANQVQAEAYMLAHLAVRVIKSPKWWEDADNGMDLEDYNVILEVFNAMLEQDEKIVEDTKEQTKKVSKKLKKKDSEEPSEEDM